MPTMTMAGLRRFVVAAFLLWFGCGAIRVPEDLGSPSVSEALLDKDEGWIPKNSSWKEDKNKCRAAQVSRLVKTAVGTPLAIAVGTSVFALATLPGPITSGMPPLSKAVASIFSSTLGALTSSGVAFKGVQVLTSTGVNALQRLLVGKRTPACCCDVSGDCDLVGVSFRFHGEICPENHRHDAEACGGAPEVITYSNKKTMQNCSCSDFIDCASKQTYRGHAWCHTEGSCGYRSLRRWDFCRFSKTSAIPDEVDQRTALSFFVPHTHHFGDRARRVVGLRSWADPLRGVAVGKESFFSLRRQCFVGTLEETLEGCAQTCIELGAPSTNNNYNCTAFAYNRKFNLCVRLAKFVEDAIFTPFLTGIDGDGWQQFVIDNGAIEEMDTDGEVTDDAEIAEVRCPEKSTRILESGEELCACDKGFWPAAPHDTNGWGRFPLGNGTCELVTRCPDNSTKIRISHSLRRARGWGEWRCRCDSDFYPKAPQTKYNHFPFGNGTCQPVICPANTSRSSPGSGSVRCDCPDGLYSIWGRGFSFYRADSVSCRSRSCPANSTARGATDCLCDDGFMTALPEFGTTTFDRMEKNSEYHFYRQTTCVPVACPANSTLTSLSEGHCKCDDDLWPVGAQSNSEFNFWEVSTCVPPVCPANATLREGRCKCDDDLWPAGRDAFARSNSEFIFWEFSSCVPAVCPATTSADGGSCRCDAGMWGVRPDASHVPSTHFPWFEVDVCEPITCPAKAIGDGEGYCNCEEGYWPYHDQWYGNSKTGGWYGTARKFKYWESYTCEPLSCPANAHWNVEPSCMCNNYYHPSDERGLFDNGPFNSYTWDGGSRTPAKFDAWAWGNLTCVPVVCPANSHHQLSLSPPASPYWVLPGYAGCKCDEGTPRDFEDRISYKDVEAGSTCPQTECIKNAHLDLESGRKCMCDVDFWPYDDGEYAGYFEDWNGWVDDDYVCKEKPWPENSVIDSGGEMYCESGFAKYNSRTHEWFDYNGWFIPGNDITCKSTQCPTNSSVHPGTAPAMCFCDNGLWPNDTEGPRVENNFSFTEDGKCEVEVNCTAHASFTGLGCICDKGFRQSGPAGLKCDSYFSRKENWTCDPVDFSCPSNASHHQCDLCRCDDGFWPSSSVGGKTDTNITFKHSDSFICEPIFCPAKSYPTSISKGSTCRCEDGFWPSNQGVKHRSVLEVSAGSEEWTCDPIICPANSSWFAASTCVCDDGFWPSETDSHNQRSQEAREYIKFDFWAMTCKQVTCPANSVFSHYDICSCKEGFLPSSPKTSLSTRRFSFWGNWTCEAQ